MVNHDDLLMYHLLFIIIIIIGHVLKVRVSIFGPENGLFDLWKKILDVFTTLHNILLAERQQRDA